MTDQLKRRGGWGRKLLYRVALLIVAPAIPLLLLPRHLWIWVTDCGECYVHAWRDFRAGEET